MERLRRKDHRRTARTCRNSRTGHLGLAALGDNFSNHEVQENHEVSKFHESTILWLKKHKSGQIQPDRTWARIFDSPVTLISPTLFPNRHPIQRAVHVV